MPISHTYIFFFKQLAFEMVLIFSHFEGDFLYNVGLRLHGANKEPLLNFLTLEV